MSAAAPDPFDVEGRIVVITGGLGQLGRQFAKTLLGRGARVAILDLGAKDETPAGFATALGDGSAADRVLVEATDVTSRESVEDALRAIVDRWGVPHALVNNAALDSPPDAPASENGPFETYPDASFDEVMRVNVKGVVVACQAIGGAMAEAGRGSVIQICSTYGLVSPDQRLYAYRAEQGGDPFFKPVAYSASKSALLNLTRYLATYWAPRVRVNTLTFGGVFNGQDPTFLENYASRVPLGRMARQDEYDGAVVFLVSDASSYMTGSNLVIDGGWTAW